MSTKTILQKFYDDTIAHLIKQGRRAGIHIPAVGDGVHFACLYRDESGAKCAAGVHIPDDVYKPLMEGNSITDLVESDYPTLEAYFPSLELASALQRLHDDEDNWTPEGFAGFPVAKIIALDHGLMPYPRPDIPLRESWQIAEPEA